MPRKAKGVHTSPETAGAQNLEGKVLPKDEAGLNQQIYPAWQHGKGIRHKLEPYGGKWPDDLLEAEVEEFCTYCVENNVKPTQPLLRLWLNVSADTLLQWKKFPDKYGRKSSIIREVLAFMECYLQGNLDKYPTGSIFLLKSSFGHAETTNINVAGNSTSPDDIKDAIAKLGLNKEGK